MREGFPESSTVRIGGMSKEQFQALTIDDFGGELPNGWMNVEQVRQSVARLEQPLPPDADETLIADLKLLEKNTPLPLVIRNQLSDSWKEVLKVVGAYLLRKGRITSDTDDETVIAIAGAQMSGMQMPHEEAKMNAAKHGNKCDPCKVVTIDTHFIDDDLEIIIDDEGKGFPCPTKFADPTPKGFAMRGEIDFSDVIEENASGRGLRLARYFSDSVEFERGGTRCIIRKNCADVLKPKKGDTIA